MVVTNHFLGGTAGGIFKYNGGFGVDIFFVISGFLMVYTQRIDKSSVSFFISRARRIYPLYIILSIPLIITAFPLERFTSIIGNVLLLPGLNNEDYHMANGPAWTLVYEMIFYVMFSFALVITRRQAGACLITCGIIVSFLMLVDGYERMGWVNLGYILSDKTMLNFAAGCILALLFNYVKLRIKFLYGAFIVFICCYVALKMLTPLDRIYKYGIPAIIIVATALITSPGKGLVYNAFHKIGDASYSIYLGHSYLVLLFKEFVITNNDNWNVRYYSSFIFVALSIFIGLAICRLIEKPIDSYLKLIISNKRTSRTSKQKLQKHSQLQ